MGTSRQQGYVRAYLATSYNSAHTVLILVSKSFVKYSLQILIVEFVDFFCVTFDHSSYSKY
jgi:hypothetical protein